jgi:FdhD protein
MKESRQEHQKEQSENYWVEERLDPDPSVLSIKCLEISGEEKRELEVQVALEEVFMLVLNGSPVATVTASPSNLKELAVGHLVSEGFVRSFDRISSVQAESRTLVCETTGPDRRKSESPMGETCPELKMRASTILDVVEGLNEQAVIWRRTGATHTSIVCDEQGGILASCEDVSRASSVDKTIGSALLAGCNPARSALITSGRLSKSMVMKGAKAGFPIMASKAAPLGTGIEAAMMMGMTLVGFVRKPKIYVYTGEDRII